MTSIRRTLLKRLFIGALALLLAGAALLQFGVRWLLTEQFDSTLRAKLGTFTSVLEQEGYDIELNFIEQSMPEYRAESQPEYLQIWLVGGDSLYRSPSLGEVDLPREYGSETDPAIEDVTLPDGRAGRTIAAEFHVHMYEPGLTDPGPAHLVVAIAKTRAELDRAFAVLLGGTVVGILLLLGVGFFIGRGAVRHGLTPLDDLARHVSTIKDPVRAPRFSDDSVPEELAPLTRSHNDLLDRLGDVFERERRTTANIAHELRTPVTEFAILTEMAERYADDPEETARKLRELREISGQMAALISTLLELGRMESGRVPLEIEPIDLAEMVRSSWSTIAAASKAKGLRFQLPEGDGPIVLADRVALSILLANLLSNAVEHAPEGDQIDCEIKNGGGRATLALLNSSNGLSPDDVDRLTEPFWRSSSARDDGSHAGLGLSLVARIAALLELDLSFKVEEGAFRARLEFDTPGAEPG